MGRGPRERFIHCGSSGVLVPVEQCKRTQKQCSDMLRLPPFDGKYFIFLQILRNFLYHSLQYSHSFLKRIDHAREVG